MTISGYEQYDQMAEAYAEKNATGAYNAFFERPSMIDMLPDLLGMSVLDLGCGSGALAAHLHRAGAQVSGVDGSSEMLKIARRDLPAEVELKCVDLNRGLPDFQNDMFDLVVSALTIHYLADLSQLAREIRRILKDGGRFVFSTHHPQMDFLSSKTKKYFSMEQIEDEWKVGEINQLVTFYRRPLASIFKPFFDCGFLCESISEGIISDELSNRFPETAERLLAHPQFLFAKLVLA
jgi:ubiquinone/menaquinone biosynthesis C-methylase UbiE